MHDHSIFPDETTQLHLSLSVYTDREFDTCTY